MDQTPEIQIHVQGKMDHTLKIILQAGCADINGVGLDSMGGATGGAMGGANKVQSQHHHQDTGEVIGVIIPHSVDPRNSLQHGCDIEHAPTIQVLTHSTERHSQFDVAISERFGYVHSADRAEQVRRNYEIQTNTSYVAVTNIRLNFGRTELSHENHRIYWEEPKQDRSAKSTSMIRFDGVPFILLAKRVLDCQHGRDWHKRSKEKDKVERKRRKKPHLQETRKLGCLANITMREVICFPEFKIDDNSEHKRKVASKKLRTALKEDEVKGQKRIYIDLPESSQHNHPIDQNAEITHQTLDDRVLKKLQELVRGGVVEVEEVRLRLQDYVKNQIFLGHPSLPLTNRRFFPNKSSLRTHIRRCQQKHKRNEPPKEFQAKQVNAVAFGENFCTQYYNTFDTNRQQLEALYHKECSLMSFEGDTRYGSAEIVAKLVSLPFTTVRHVVTSMDCHCTIDDSLLITVLGQLQADSDPKKTFHQTFILKQHNSNFFIVNDIFRLGVHNF